MTRRKKMSLLLLPVLLVLALIAFAVLAPVKFLNTFTPSSNFTKQANLTYGDLPRQKMDIYSAVTRKPNSPVVVFVHGGGWHSGNKEMYKFLAEGFTRSGYDVVVPNYRLFPEGIYPNMLLDSAKAIGKTAQLYPDRPLALVGHSAGAYNVLMMGLAPEYLRAEGVDVCQRVAGVISLAGPTGEIKLASPRYVEVIPDKFNGASAAINNLNHSSPPIFIINGAEDTQVDPKNAIGLADKMKAKGKPVTLKIYEDHTHNDLVKYLSRYLEKNSTIKKDIMAFIDDLAKSGQHCD